MLDPATNMPPARVLQASGDDAAAAGLSVKREDSSIPREEDTTWQYPSARMFYNALQRKGKGVPAEAIDSMLAVHNYLNEAVWREIVEHERYLHPGCVPRLKRFLGRPDDWSPRAWYHVRVRGGAPPFDRHDWVIDRCGREVRYVIDYYAGHPIPGEASFSVDIRPALDSPHACLDRARLFWRRLWSGGEPSSPQLSQGEMHGGARE